MFIELTHTNGLKVFININNIISVIAKYDELDKTLIIYASAGMPQENYDIVLDDYEFVKGKINTALMK